jgi:hypothetical protein
VVVAREEDEEEEEGEEEVVEEEEEAKEEEEKEEENEAAARGAWAGDPGRGRRAASATGWSEAGSGRHDAAVSADPMLSCGARPSDWPDYLTRRTDQQSLLVGQPAVLYSCRSRSSSKWRINEGAGAPGEWEGGGGGGVVAGRTGRGRAAGGSAGWASRDGGPRRACRKWRGRRRR